MHATLRTGVVVCPSGTVGQLKTILEPRSYCSPVICRLVSWYLVELNFFLDFCLCRWVTMEQIVIRTMQNPPSETPGQININKINRVDVAVARFWYKISYIWTVNLVHLLLRPFLHTSLLFWKPFCSNVD